MIFKVTSHIEEYIARYTVLILAILTPFAGLLGSIAADLGGTDTSTGRAVLAAASALGVAIGGVTFLKNLGNYQALRDFGSSLDIAKDMVEFQQPLIANNIVTPEESGARPDKPGALPSPATSIGRVEPGQPYPES